MTRAPVAILVLAAAGAACAPPSLHVQALVMPEWRETTRLRRITVQPLSGEHGEEARARLHAALARASFRGVTCFTVLPYLPPPHDAPVGVAHLGGDLGADAVLVAEVTAASTTKDWRSTSRCDQYERGVCVKSVDVRCDWSEARFALSASLHEVATGAIVHAGAFEGTAKESETCGDEADDLAGRLVQGAVGALLDKALDRRAALLREAQAAAVDRLVVAMTPRHERLAVPLARPGGAVPWPIRERLGTALEELQAELTPPEAVCAILEEARAAAPDEPAVLYDLGACAERRERLDEARALYARALALGVSRRAWAEAALGRVERTMDELAVLAGGGSAPAESGRGEARPGGKGPSEAPAAVDGPRATPERATR